VPFLVPDSFRHDLVCRSLFCLFFYSFSLFIFWGFVSIDFASSLVP
jgi:hypothetical protein